MIRLTFHIPTDRPSQNNLALIRKSVFRAKTAIEQAIMHNRPLNTPTDLDKFVWDDLATVIAGHRNPPEGMSKDWTMWSLHKEEPHWGAPLFTLSADELNDSITLTLRVSGDWADDEVFPLCIRFKCVEPLSRLKSEWSAIESTNGLSYWVVLSDESLLAVLEEPNDM